MNCYDYLFKNKAYSSQFGREYDPLTFLVCEWLYGCGLSYQKIENNLNDPLVLLYCLMVFVCLPGAIRNSVDLSTLLLSPSIVLNYLRSISATKDIWDEGEYFRNRACCFGECKDSGHTCSCFKGKETAIGNWFRILCLCLSSGILNTTAQRQRHRTTAPTRWRGRIKEKSFFKTPSLQPMWKYCCHLGLPQWDRIIEREREGKGKVWTDMLGTAPATARKRCFVRPYLTHKKLRKIYFTWWHLY